LIGSGAERHKVFADSGLTIYHALNGPPGSHFVLVLVLVIVIVLVPVLVLDDFSSFAVCHGVALPSSLPVGELAPW